MFSSLTNSLILRWQLDHFIHMFCCQSCSPLMTPKTQFVTHIHFYVFEHLAPFCDHRAWQWIFTIHPKYLVMNFIIMIFSPQESDYWTGLNIRLNLYIMSHTYTVTKHTLSLKLYCCLVSGKKKNMDRQCCHCRKLNYPFEFKNACPCNW